MSICACKVFSCVAFLSRISYFFFVAQILSLVINSGRYDGEENSVALPFLKRPPLLDGSHAGDFGFDPLGFTENYDLYTMQEAELRHARYERMNEQTNGIIKLTSN